MLPFCVGIYELIFWITFPIVSLYVIYPIVSQFVIPQSYIHLGCFYQKEADVPFSDWETNLSVGQARRDVPLCKEGNY